MLAAFVNSFNLFHNQKVRGHQAVLKGRKHYRFIAMDHVKLCIDAKGVCAGDCTRSLGSVKSFQVSQVTD